MLARSAMPIATVRAVPFIFIFIFLSSFRCFSPPIGDAALLLQATCHPNHDRFTVIVERNKVNYSITYQSNWEMSSAFLRWLAAVEIKALNPLVREARP